MYGSAGVGSNAHLYSELLAQMTGTEFVHVPYKSSAAGLSDLLGGQLDFLVDALSGAMTVIKGGKSVRVLGIGNSTRSSFLPEVPTIAEAGVPGFAHGYWTAIFAPGTTPAPIVDMLSTEVHAIVSQPSFRDEIKPFSIEPLPLTSADVSARMRREIAAWGPRIKVMKIEPQ